MELNVALISNKAPNLHYVICFEMIHCFKYKQKTSVKGKEVVLSSCFLWKLLRFIVKIFKTYCIPKEQHSSKQVNILILKTTLFIPQNIFQSIPTSSSSLAAEEEACIL